MFNFIWWLHIPDCQKAYKRICNGSIFVPLETILCVLWRTKSWTPISLTLLDRTNRFILFPNKVYSEGRSPEVRVVLYSENIILMGRVGWVLVNRTPISLTLLDRPNRFILFPTKVYSEGRSPEVRVVLYSENIILMGGVRWVLVNRTKRC